MTDPHVEQSAPRGSRLLPIFFFFVLTALAVVNVWLQRPADASGAGFAALAVSEAQIPAAVAEASGDNGPGMDEAALAKLPEQ